jgi:pantetheine-phosphate adenylyltransferase
VSAPTQSVTAIYAGSFDPPTCGHSDIIERAARLFGRLVVAVARNDDKQPLFRTEERMEMLREICAPLPHVEVMSFEGLLADFARKQNASTLVRGLRNGADLEAEMPMAAMNHRLGQGLETIFLPADARFAFVSSRLIRQVAALGGDFSGLTTPGVAQRLRARLGKS